MNSHFCQAPKLDFRHSDNINHFFNFVRGVGLPEVRHYIGSQGQELIRGATMKGVYIRAY